MHILSKSTYIKGLQCEKALYLQKKHPYLRDRLSIENRVKFKRGTDVGVLAHQYFPGGIDMSPASPTQFAQKAKATWDNLINAEVNTMYEAVFQYNDTLIMLDMLVRDGDKWLAVEVKSSMALSKTYYNDAALQYYVLHGCQVPLSDFVLMHINADYVKDGPIDVKQLFKLESVMHYVQEREAYVAANVERLKSVVALPHAPKVNIGTQCHDPYTCDFIGHCWKSVPDNSFLYTTAMDDKRLFDYYFSGIDTNDKMNRILENDELEAHQVEALESGTYYVDFKKLFSMAPNPKPKTIAFLNMLLYRPAVPETDGAKPYQEIILGFSLLGDLEENGSYCWDCFADHTRCHEAIPILTERLQRYESVVCFTPQNLTTTLLRHEIMQNKNVGYKVFNLFNILQQSDFYHPSVKNGFTLQHVAVALSLDEKPVDHNGIILEALRADLIGFQQAKDLLVAENEAVAKIYQLFFK